MEELQERLISPPVLDFPLSKGRYNVNTDVCDKIVGCILIKGQEDKIES